MHLRLDCFEVVPGCVVEPRRGVEQFAVWLLAQSGWSFGPRRGVAVSSTIAGDGGITTTSFFSCSTADTRGRAAGFVLLPSFVLLQCCMIGKFSRIIGFHPNSISISLHHSYLTQFEQTSTFHKSGCLLFEVQTELVLQMSVNVPMLLCNENVAIRRRSVSFLRTSCSNLPKTRSAGRKLCSRIGKVWLGDEKRSWLSIIGSMDNMFSFLFCPKEESEKVSALFFLSNV